ncbi:hypothetical protein NESM_000378900 [Novymonas esmeraldas]|uniref:Uncharacterized protein n=1 Tax=Novymonas esmeraldas TaxID=1808958 RepID=A0AAW0ELS4_9TRYP
MYNGGGSVKDVEDRYSAVKWFHAVNSPAELLDATQAIGQRVLDTRRSGARGSDAGVNHRTGGGGSDGASYTAFGIEADVQWHTSLEVAVMGHDPLPPADSGPAVARDAPMLLEEFFHVLAEAVEEWSRRRRSALETSAAAASICAAATTATPPLHIIVKLDFKALPAAQQLLQHAAARSWAGLEALCRHHSGDDGSAATRRQSLHSLLNDPGHAPAPPPQHLQQHSPLPATPPPAAALDIPSPSAAAAAAATEAAAAAASVAVELWWNADVVAQRGATPHPLSFAAASTSTVQALMAHTAVVLGPRIPLGFSLGWVLCPRAVPAELLTPHHDDGAAATATPLSSTHPRYVFYNFLEDAPAMNAFLDGFCAELQRQAPAHARSGGAGPSPSPLVRLITFPMLFESVFADVYTAKERQHAFASSAATAASLAAAARLADETRRVASTVTAHTTALLSSTGVANRGASALSRTRHAAGGWLEENARVHAAPPSSATPLVLLTFWKGMRPPPPHSTAEAHGDAAAQCPANVDRAARVFFPCCTIDG